MAKMEQDNKTFNISNNTKSTHDGVFADIIRKCYKEMYANAQPPVDYDELIELAKAGKEDKQHPFYTQHYLSAEEYKYILEKYVESYRIKSDWHDHVDTIIDWFDEPIVDKYIEENDDEPGYRSYENLTPLIKLIGEESFNVVIDYINKAKNFYKFGRNLESSFNWAIMQCSPTSNKQTVIDYWKTKGVELEIKDRDPEYFYDRYYLGLTEETTKEYED